MYAQCAERLTQQDPFAVRNADLPFKRDGKIAVIAVFPWSWSVLIVGRIPFLEIIVIIVKKC